jgi:hypothetical protein
MGNTIHHDTSHTVNRLQFHLGRILAHKLRFEVSSEEEHDDRNGEGVASVTIDGLFEVYPMAGTETRKTIAGDRTRDITQWAIDRMVDDSDPSVGMYGSAPEDHSLHNSFDKMMDELAREIVSFQLDCSPEAESEMAMAKEIEEASAQETGR